MNKVKVREKKKKKKKETDGLVEKYSQEDINKNLIQRERQTHPAAFHLLSPGVTRRLSL